MTHGHIEGHAFDDAWVEFSWPRPRDSLGGHFGGHFGGGAMMEGTHDDDDMVR